MIPARIVVAPDSFGGWKTASEIAERIATPLRAAGLRVVTRPISDGGEGLLDVLQSASLLDRVEHRQAYGPHGEPRGGLIGWRQAVPIIESSTWLRTLARPHAPWSASSAGLGHVVASLLDTPGTIGLGGSSTVDMGLGFLRAVGARLLDRRGRPIDGTARSLWSLHRIEVSPGLLHNWTVWSDVSTPIERGAVAYSPQKGVAPDHLAYLASGWAHVVNVWERWRASHALPRHTIGHLGGGAAGGLGYTLMQLGAHLKLGAPTLTALLLPDLCADDLVITGEGCLDATTGESKVVAAVALACERRQAALVLVVGSVGSGAPDFGDILVCADAARANATASSSRDTAFMHTIQVLVERLSGSTRDQSPQAAREGRRSQ
ncbi:MAG TPA: hypothetical protein DFR83_12775 [Deltaproteobacteria bacterium]|nr:hypothetical protein [Deltaproteobacteria bacterium]